MSNPDANCAGTAKLQLGVSRPNAPQRFVGSRNGEWRSRGYLPHFESAGAIQHVTFRLADSLPEEALARVEWEMDVLEKEGRQNESRQAGAWRSQERRRRMEELMDAGLGSCLLKQPKIAQFVEEALKHFDGVRYRLIAWVLMPNHIHVLFETITPWTMAKVVWSWKAWTGRQIIALLKNARPEIAKLQLGAPKPNASKIAQAETNLIDLEQDSPIWFREYWDRFVRNERHLRNVIEYINQNPVKAGLVSKPEEWPWSSAAALGRVG